MLKWIKTLWAHVLGMRGINVPSVARRSKPKNSVYGPFLGIQNAYHISDILDRLPDYFRDMAVLKKYDGDAYQLFGQLGGIIAPEGSIFGNVRPTKRPAISCIFMTPQSDRMEQSSDGPRLYVSVIYAIKLKQGSLITERDGSSCILPKTGCSYRFILVYNRDGSPIGGEFIAHIDDEGYSRALPMKSRPKITTKIRRGRGSPGYKRVSHGTEVCEVPRWLSYAAADDEENPLTVEEFVAFIVNTTLNIARPEHSIMVRAKRGALTAAWTIDVNDGKRFFADRDTGLAVDGKRKRILHYVGEHERLVGNQARRVRAHYRGERAFGWEGYRIDVGGLGFHFDDVFASKLEAIESDDMEGGGMLSMEQFARSIVQRYNKPVTLSRHIH